MNKLNAPLQMAIGKWTCDSNSFVRISYRIINGCSGHGSVGTLCVSRACCGTKLGHKIKVADLASHPPSPMGAGAVPEFMPIGAPGPNTTKALEASEIIYASEVLKNLQHLLPSLSPEELKSETVKALSEGILNGAFPSASVDLYSTLSLLGQAKTAHRPSSVDSKMQIAPA